MSDIMQKVGNRIAQLRKNAQLTQAQLAEQANLSRDFLSRLERGVTGVSIESLEELAQALKIELKDFFNFEGVAQQFGEIESVTVTVRRPDGTTVEQVLKT